MFEAAQLPGDAFNHHASGGYQLDATICGGVDICVLRFLPANLFDVSPEQYVHATDTIANGTRVVITRRGKYYAGFCLNVIAHADTTLVAGISKNGTVLAANPVYAAGFGNGFLGGTIVEATVPAASAGVIVPLRASATFEVSSAEASAVGGCIIRFHAGDAGGTPTANALSGGVTGNHGFQVKYLGEYVN